MSVSSSTLNRVLGTKPTGLYLMELRRRVAEPQARRQRLVIESWALPDVQQVPILHRPIRFARGRL